MTESESRSQDKGIFRLNAAAFETWVSNESKRSIVGASFHSIDIYETERQRAVRSLNSMDYRASSRNREVLQARVALIDDLSRTSKLIGVQVNYYDDELRKEIVAKLGIMARKLEADSPLVFRRMMEPLITDESLPNIIPTPNSLIEDTLNTAKRNAAMLYRYDSVPYDIEIVSFLFHDQ